MEELIKESWFIYESHKDEEFVVSPSIPILFFGNSEAYSGSKLKVITVGLNPSRVEFPDDDRFKRFAQARNVYPHILYGHHYREYLASLNGYFANEPYSKWFNSFEPLLSGLGASYYEGAPNIALHTDLCSPLATDPTWSSLSREQRALIQSSGTAMWHRLVDTLTPDVIIASVAADHLNKINFARLAEWQTVHTVERENPYHVRLVEVTRGDGKKSALVFGRAANTPFGTVSTADKRRIGERLREYIGGE